MTVTVTINDILDILNSAAPFALAESWDNVGLLVGSPHQEVKAILVALDPGDAILEEAISLGIDTIITHHPVIFKPLATINTGEAQGRLLAKALTHGIAIIACHTNLDSARNGVSDILCRRLGLEEIVPLSLDRASAEAGTGIGRIGLYRPPLSAAQFLVRLHQGLELDQVLTAGRLPEMITRVAVCGGSGSELAPLAQKLGADLFLSAEIKHSTATWAIENRFCVIDGSHYATEKPAVALLVDTLRRAITEKGWRIPVSPAAKEHHPFVHLNINPQSSKQQTVRGESF